VLRFIHQEKLKYDVRVRQQSWNRWGMKMLPGDETRQNQIETSYQVIFTMWSLIRYAA